MKTFFNVTDLDTAFSHVTAFSEIGVETVPLADALGRVLGESMACRENLPDFSRSVMDGYALKASSTFGASEANPAYLTVKGSVAMGRQPGFSIEAGEAARISTGGALPEGADSVVMIEHTETVDETTIEVYRSVAPGQHIIQKGEDFKTGEMILHRGQSLRAQEIGLLAALGKTSVTVCKKAVVGIISTGDEVVPVDQTPEFGKVRDVNSYTLGAMVQTAGGRAVNYGIVEDDIASLYDMCIQAHKETDMLIISGGSSMGPRDYALEAIGRLPDARILLHGIPISPGKPTILAQAEGKPVWGLPGHVVSAMIVFEIVVKPFLEKLNGLDPGQRRRWPIPARLDRNVASAQGRMDFIRVRLVKKNGEYWAQPILGKSGLIHTLVQADGVIAINMHSEGLEKGTSVDVIPM